MRPRGLLPLLWVLLTGCATEAPMGHRATAGNLRAGGGAGGGSPAALVGRMAMGALVETDAFEALLGRAGLRDFNELPPREADLTPEDAARLYDALLERPVTLEGFGPRRVAFHLLGEFMEGEEELSRAALLKRLERYRFLAVLRPDGYLAWALLLMVTRKRGFLVIGRPELPDFSSRSLGAAVRASWPEAVVAWR
jgi:hypothetical protein